MRHRIYHTCIVFFRYSKFQAKLTIRVPGYSSKQIIAVISLDRLAKSNYSFEDLGQNKQILDCKLTQKNLDINQLTI